MRFVFLAVALAIPALSLGQGNSTEFGAREVYRSSEQLPDATAYVLFLKTLKGLRTNQDPQSQDAYWHVIGSALGYEPHSDISALQNRAQLFEGQLERIASEKGSARREVLCRLDSFDARSDEQLYDLIESADAVTRIVEHKHYRLAKSALSAREKSALQNYLADLKLRTTHYVVDSRVVLDRSLGGPGPAKAVAAFCERPAGD
jgi:hypothetical protein